MPSHKVQRKLIPDEELHVKRSTRRKVAAEVRSRASRKVDWDAVGMPPPGPDFVRMAMSLGDELTETKITSVNPDTGKSRSVKAFNYGENLRDLYDQAICTPGFRMQVEIKTGKLKEVEFVPGHRWSAGREDFINLSDASADKMGPSPSPVMVIGKMPGLKDEKERRNLVSPAGQLLMEALDELQVQNIGDWYVTNVCKFRPPDGSRTIKSGWLKDCLPILQQELRVVRPKYILCLGADASKCLLGKKFSVNAMEGRVAEITYPINPDNPDPDLVVYHKALVMTTVSPSQVMRDESDRRRMMRALARFNRLTEGNRWDLKSEETDFRTIYDYWTLLEYLIEIEADERKEDDLIGTDAEWHGEHPVNDGSYLRTIQLSHYHNSACAVVLNDNEGKPCFLGPDGETSHKEALELLAAFFRGGKYQLPDDDGDVRFRKKRVVGHFFNADLEWLVKYGLDIQEQYSVPLYAEAFEDQPFADQEFYETIGFGPGDDIPPFILTYFRGGIDTGFAAHAIEEATQYSLEMLTTRYTDAPRYDIELKEWIEDYCREEGIKAAHLEGYGPVPDEILVPYGCWDAAATLDLAYALLPKLDYDYHGNNCREAFWETMIAAPSILDIHMNGICVDKPGLDELTEVFVEAKYALEEEIREDANWPEFNIRSVYHVREFLFGEQYNGKINKEDGGVVRIRPEGAKSLYVDPFLDTSKPPKRWEDIRAEGKEDEHTPGTAKEILKILAQDNLDVSKEIGRVRDFRFLDQVLKSVLREPLSDDDGNWLMESDIGGGLDASDFTYTSFGGNLGGLIYDKGLAAAICSDGRVRTHIYPTKETGRWSSARPPLQVFSKKRDEDYKRLLGDRYNRKLRTVLVPSPGHVMIEADYTGAELFGMAVMSGDLQMLDHCFRNQLPESDPNYFDIHSSVTKLAFGLDCPSTKAGLKAIGKDNLRNVAKAVIFGIAYGRGAKAIALAVREQDVFITVEDAQRVIDAVFALYPRLKPFFEECQRRATDERWIQNCFGRYRRFPRVNPNDFGMIGEFERQAMNFPIQSLVASTMNRAMAYTWDYNKNVEPGLFRILLQIHDAILLECRYEHVEHIIDNVLPLTMREMVPVYPTGLDGVPIEGRGPYRLGIDSEVLTTFGSHITAEECEKYGIPLVTAGGTVIATAA